MIACKVVGGVAEHKDAGAEEACALPCSLDVERGIALLVDKHADAEKSESLAESERTVAVGARSEVVEDADAASSRTLATDGREGGGAVATADGRGASPAGTGEQARVVGNRDLAVGVGIGTGQVERDGDRLGASRIGANGPVVGVVATEFEQQQGGRVEFVDVVARPSDDDAANRRAVAEGDGCEIAGEGEVGLGGQTGNRVGTRVQGGEDATGPDRVDKRRREGVDGRVAVEEGGVEALRCGCQQRASGAAKQGTLLRNNNRSDGDIAGGSALHVDRHCGHRGGERGIGRRAGRGEEL